MPERPALYFCKCPSQTKLCMYKRCLSASKPAAEPQIAAATPGTHTPSLLLCSLARRQLRICLPGRCGLPQAQTAIATTAAIQRSSPPRQTCQVCNITCLCNCADMVPGRLSRQSALDTGKTTPATPRITDEQGDEECKSRSSRAGRRCGGLAGGSRSGAKHFRASSGRRWIGLSVLA